MSEIKEIVKKETEPTVGYVWKGLALFLLGVIIGVLVSPIKNGCTIASNNRIDGSKKYGADDFFDDDDDDDEELSF